MLLLQTGIVRLFLFSACIGTYENEEKSFDNFWEKHSMKNLFSGPIGLSILIGFVISFILYLFGMDFDNALYIGWLIWIIVYGINFHHFWINPEANHAEILQNVFMKPKDQRIISNQRELEDPPRGQRVVFTGMNRKFPWELRIEKPISLVKTTPVEGIVIGQEVGKNERGEDAPGKGNTFTIKWKGALAAISDDGLVRFYQTDEEAANTFFRLKINLAIQSMLGHRLGDKIRENPDAFIKTDLKDLLGGESIDKEERQYARYLYKLSIESVDKEETAKNIDEFVANAGKFASAVKTVLADCGDDSLTKSTVLKAFLGEQSADPVVLIQGNQRKK